MICRRSDALDDVMDSFCVSLLYKTNGFHVVVRLTVTVIVNFSVSVQ